MVLKDHAVALLTDSGLRRPLRRVIERALPDLAVIAYAEIPADMMIDPVSIVRVDAVFPDGADDGPHIPSPQPAAAPNQPAPGITAA